VTLAAICESFQVDPIRAFELWTGNRPTREAYKDITRAVMDAAYLADCYRMDAERPKDMTPDQVTFMMEADELTDAYLVEHWGEAPTEGVHERLARMRQEQGEGNDLDEDLT
jgi:hypothetical protein